MLAPGKWMGERYRLDERIATGGMGDVWKCEDTVLGRAVALKVLQPAMLEEPGFADRFRAEARVMATINHPGVVQVYDYGENALDGGGKVAYLVMEYVEGEPLHRVLANHGRLAPARVMDLTAQAADALQAAHDRGIIHRDVKPGNLLVRPNGKLVLTDFGIARSALTGNLTQAGAVLGTASYVSPEQASGSSGITPASDVYSLGVVAYQCLAGRRPFEGDNPIEVAMKHVRDEPPPLPPDVPDNARAVVTRAMAKDVAQRWPDAKTMGEAARTAAAGGAVPGAGRVAGAAAAGAAAGLGAAAPAAAVAGGTAVMPSVGGSPAGASGQGGYARGAASVPTAAPAEEDYGYGGGGGGGYGGYGDYAGGPPKKGKGGLYLGLAVAVLLLALGGGLIAYLMSGPDQTPPGGDKGTPSATAEMVTLNAQDYLHKDPGVVEKDLTENKGMKVQRKERKQDGFRPNTVNGINPDGEVAKGSTITIYVQPKSALPGVPTLPGTGGNTGGNTSPPPANSPSPSEDETDDDPSASASPGTAFNRFHDDPAKDD